MSHQAPDGANESDNGSRKAFRPQPLLVLPPANVAVSNSLGQISAVIAIVVARSTIRGKRSPRAFPLPAL